MTAISPSFRMSDATWSTVDSDDESAWVFGGGPADPPLQPFAPMRSRFVYAFQRVDGTTILYAEYELDRDGNLGRCEGLVRETKERGSAEAVFVHPGTNNVNLPDNVNGKPAEYFFFATRVRLTSRTILFIQQNKPKAIPFLNVASNQSVVGEFVPVVDPLFVARQLNLLYQRACNALLDMSVTYEEQNANVRKRVVERSQTLLLAQLLKRVLDSGKGSSVKSSFKDGSGANVTAFIDAYNRELRSLNEEKDRRGAALTKFLNSDLMKFTEQVYAVSEATDFHAFLNGLAPACERLNESPNGRARLGGWFFKTQPDWLKKYVFPEAELGGDQFQVARKSFSALAVFWAEFAPAIASELPERMPEIIGRGIQRVTKRIIVTTRPETAFITRRFQVTGAPISAAKYFQLDAPNEKGLRDIIADWASGAESKAINEAAEHLGRMVECANLMLAAKAFLEAESDVAWKGLNLFGAGLDTVGAFQALGKLSSKTLRRVAACSAAIDAVLAAKDGFDAYQKGDTNALIGFTSVTLGSTLMFLGWASTMTGIGASASIVGLPAGLVLGVGGAILVAAGYILAVFTADSELETFVKHCYFGGEFGKGGASPKWAGGTLAGWGDGANGLIRQVTALYNLLAGFVLQARFDTALTIRPGLLPQEARFRIEAELVGTGLKDLEVPRQFVLEVDVASKSMKSTGAHPADVGPISFITDSQGTVSIQVDLRPQPGTVPSNSFLTVSRCKGSVQLNLFGDRTVLVPSGSPVPYDLKAMTHPIFGGPVASVDF